MNMTIHGLAIASHIHFIARFIITYTLIINDKEACECLIPMSHPDSFKEFPEMIKVGYYSFVNRVFGWWSFDVYTQLAGMLTDTDIAA